MRIEVIKNYLLQEQCVQLNTLTQYGHDNNLMTLGGFTILRYTSRLDTALYTYPQSVFDIATQVRAYCGVANYPVASGQGSDGIVTTYMPTGADIFNYQAPLIEGQGQLWSFVVTQQTEGGGITQINGVDYSVDQGDLLVYLTSNNTQYTTPVTGSTTRICWSFGNLVPTDAWESGQIVVGG
jgi:hypothetical protein